MLCGKCDGNSSSNQAILYLGSRGAGVRFFVYLNNLLATHNVPFIAICRPDIYQSGETIRQIHVQIPSKLKVLLRIGRGEVTRTIIQLLEKNAIKNVIIPMAHPWDLHLQKELQDRDINLVRIVHDAHRHSGDFFPNQHHIKRMIENTYVVTLSQHVSNSLPVSQDRKISLIHPILPQLETCEEKEFEFLRDIKYDLIIGRLRRYQRPFSVAVWWLRNSDDPTRKLVVAGKASRLFGLLSIISPRIYVMRKWLSECEVSTLIKGAALVLCLYKEASQSGVIADAAFHKVNVLATDVGGLAEQISCYGNGMNTSRNKTHWQRDYAKIISQEEDKSAGGNNWDYFDSKFLHLVMRTLR